MPRNSMAAQKSRRLSAKMMLLLANRQQRRAKHLGRPTRTKHRPEREVPHGVQCLTLDRAIAHSGQCVGVAMSIGKGQLPPNKPWSQAPDLLQPYMQSAIDRPLSAAGQ